MSSTPKVTIGPAQPWKLVPPASKVRSAAQSGTVNFSKPGTLKVGNAPALPQYEQQRRAMAGSKVKTYGVPGTTGL